MFTHGFEKVAGWGSTIVNTAKSAFRGGTSEAIKSNVAKNIATSRAANAASKIHMNASVPRTGQNIRQTMGKLDLTEAQKNRANARLKGVRVPGQKPAANALGAPAAPAQAGSNAASTGSQGWTDKAQEHFNTAKTWIENNPKKSVGIGTVSGFALGRSSKDDRRGSYPEYR